MSKNVLITGAASGIGLHIAEQLARAGHSIIVTDLNEKVAQQAAQKIVNQGGTARGYALNVADSQAIEDFFSTFTQPVDVLINNAGALLNKPFTETSMQDFEYVYKTNVFGVAELTRLVLPKMGKNGHVVTISSMGGVQGSTKFPGLSAYSSSKGALSILSECLAKDFEQDDISVNCLALGAVNTDMLKQAFPDYQAETEPDQMAGFISNFALKNNTVMNGVTQIVSVSNP